MKKRCTKLFRLLQLLLYHHDNAVDFETFGNNRKFIKCMEVIFFFSNELKNGISQEYFQCFFLMIKS